MTDLDSLDTVADVSGTRWGENEMREAVALAAVGMSNRDIGVLLGRTRRAVQTMLHNVGFSRVELEEKFYRRQNGRWK